MMSAQLNQKHLKISSDVGIFQMMLQGIEKAYHLFSKLDHFLQSGILVLSIVYILYNIMIKYLSWYTIAFIHLPFFTLK